MVVLLRFALGTTNFETAAEHLKLKDLFHRIVWKRLPRQARRSALFALTRYAAAKPDPDALAVEPIIVVGCLRSATGLGEGARLSYQTLLDGGMDVYAIDVSSVLMQPRELSDFSFRDGSSIYGVGT